MALDERKGVWKSGKGKGRHTPKGRQLDDRHGTRCARFWAGPRRRDLLIEYLHRIQDSHGHLSAAHLRALAEEMRLSQAEVYEVATFYAHFDVVKEGEVPPPALTIRVCDSLACEMAGRAGAQIGAGGRARPGRGTRAARALHGALRHRAGAGTGPQPYRPRHARKGARGDRGGRHACACPGLSGPCRVSRWRAAMPKLAELREGGDFETVQQTLLDAGVRGLGGAGFPSGKKWGFVRAEPGPRYVAVNGDEGEPGTFKDRYYLEREPHMFLEGSADRGLGRRGRDMLHLHARRIPGGAGNPR